MSSTLAALKAQRGGQSSAGLATNVLNKGTVESVYEIGKELGVGGFSVVKEGKNRKTQQRVAIKFINKKKSTRAQLKEVQHEINALSQLRHPNIVELIEVFDTDNEYVIVMEMVEGGELFERVQKEESFSESNAKLVLIQVVHALSYIHGKNWVHRDLKVI